MYKLITFYTIKGILNDGKYVIYIVEDNELHSTYIYNYVSGICLLGHMPAGITLDEVLEMVDKELSSSRDYSIEVIDGLNKDDIAGRAYFCGLQLAQTHVYEGLLPSLLQLKTNKSIAKHIAETERIHSLIRKDYKNLYPDGL